MSYLTRVFCKCGFVLMHCTCKKDNMIKLYKKKPIPVEVVQFYPNKECTEFLEKWSNGAVEVYSFNNMVQIKTYEGVMRPSVGDYVIKGSEGEFWFVRESVFNKTYEEVDINKKTKEELEGIV